jgi:riboflavin synthase
MFTGIIEAVGKVTQIERQGEAVRLTVASGMIAEDVALGDSVSINGVCLTVTAVRAPHISFDAVHETMRKTTLGALQHGDNVNLERALPVNGRLGGHIVQGHVDGAGRIASIRPDGNSYIVYIDAAPELMRYIVNKGSIAIDGISLTVAESADRTFSLSIIPHTWEHTTLRDKRAGDSVNIECDILGKYVEKMLGGYISSGNSVHGYEDRGGGVTMDLLSRSGYIGVTTATETDNGGRW